MPDPNRFVVNIPVVNLVEAEFDKEKREITATALVSGWSKNGNFYSKRVAESLAGFLLNKRKVYVNHAMRPGDKKYVGGRDMRDWAAQILEAYGEDGKAKVRLHVFEEPDGWLYERAEKCPNEVGLSIDAQAKVKYGEMEGKKGRIVEEFVKINSLDFVQNASAGGKVDSVVEGDDAEVINELIATLDEVEETESTKLLKELLEKAQEGENVKGILEVYLKEISKTEYEETEYPAEAYIYVPDPKKPNTWRYRVMSYEGNKLVLDKYLLYRSFKSFLYSVLDDYYNELPDDIPQIKTSFVSLFKKAKISLPKNFKEDEMDESETRECLSEIEEITEVKKTEAGSDYPASAYAYVPDLKKPSTWKLRVKNFINGKLTLDRAQLGKAAAAFSSGGFRGQKVSLPSGDVAKVKAKLRGFYKTLGVGANEIPKQLKETEDNHQDSGGEKIVELKEATMEDLISERNDLFEAIKEAIEKESKDKEERARLTEENEDLKKKIEEKDGKIKEQEKTIDEYQVKEKAAEKDELIKTKIEEAKLEKELVTEIFLKQLKEAENEEEIDQLIADRKNILESSKGKIEGVGPKDKSKEGKDEFNPTVDEFAEKFK